jgi:asparagine synthase (glutamine-hydrolysing)
MSVQFGRWNFEGEAVAPGFNEKVNAVLLPYGPDRSGSFSDGNVSILYRAFHTTKESRSETQPHSSASGTVITWDGRLDNRAELIRDLPDVLTNTSTEVDLVLAAYERWGTDCFARLVGDWALAIWSPRTSSLVLAKDFAGTRSLYYSFDKNEITWSTILDPLVLSAKKRFALCEEYIAGWLSLFPAADLTPYVGIYSVPPSCFVRLERNRHAVRKYWDFDPGARIRYRTDSEYEERFRFVFAEAVRRRLRSDSPILAELSGGMDSSSIVCVADALIACGAAETPRLDTVSYYNDSEPHWNERPYFTRVEEKRGRTGCHIDIGAAGPLRHELKTNTFAATPGSRSGRGTEASRQFAACVRSQGNRVVLSGIGGDEVTGGVPTPTPELMDLLARARLKALARQLKVWAISKRKPWFHLLSEAARGFLSPALVGVPKHLWPAEWLHPRFVKRHRAALTGYPSRLKFFGPPPSFQENLCALNALRRQISCSSLSSEPPREKRYPYLDRDLLEFMYAIPREQLVRPGQRRSLMRRALVGIVPEELLNRRRKAFAIRSPMAAISGEWSILIEKSQQMQSTSLEIVDANAFCEAVQKARHGQEIRTVAMTRTLQIEYWLASVRDQGILVDDSSVAAHDSALLGERRKEPEPRPKREFS